MCDAIRRRRGPAVLAALLAGLLLTLVQPAGVALAATFDVTQTADAADPSPGDGVCDGDAGTAGHQCSLRAAVQTANALGGSHVIRLPAGTYTLTVTGASENAAATGDLDVTATITIRSAHTAAGGVTVNGNATDRVFDVRPGGSLTLIGLTVTNGATNAQPGAGISSNGTLTLLGTTVSGHAVSGTGGGARGGGIAVNNGTATLYGSTVSGNTSSTRGGGIFVETPGTLNVFTSLVSGNTAANTGGGIDTVSTTSLTDSTIQGNQAVIGGGIAQLQTGSLALTRVTISGNTTTNFGGGLAISSSTGVTVTATLTNVTISGNSSGGSQGGGLYVDDNNGTVTVSLTNVTVGPNTGGLCDGLSMRLNAGSVTLNVANTVFAAECAFQGGATPTNLGGNARAAGTGCPGTDQTLNLGSLQDNGGFTQTLELGVGSGAIDFGTGPGCPTADQRGLARAGQGAACDSGAYEVKAAGNGPPVISTIPTQTLNEDSATGPIAFQIADPDSPNAGGLTLDISANTSPAIPTGSFTFQGSGTSRTLFGTPDPDKHGSGSVIVRVSDGTDTATTSFTLDVNAVNDAPSFTALGGNPPAVNEDAVAPSVAGFATGMTPGPATATDEVGQTLSFNVAVTGTTGTLSFTSGPEIDAVTGTLSYQPSPHTNSTATVRVTLEDDGGTTNGGVNTSAPQTFTITVNAVNDPPVNTVPAAQTTPANTPKVFSTANGNAISIADLDAGTSPVQVTLGVTTGTGILTLGSSAGLTVIGNGTATVTATGTLANLNAGLQGLTFTPTTNVTGTTLTVTTDDQGNTGSGGNLQDVDTVQVAVDALPTATPTPTGTLPPTATFTATPTWTSTPTATTTWTPTPTPTTTATATATATSTATPTATPIPPDPFVSPGDDDTDKPRKETEEQRQQREDTNTGNRDDVYTEGNVVEVGPGTPPSYVLIANRDGLVRIDLLCGDDCPTIQVGDYIAVDGEKQSEARFEATEVTVTRPR